MTSRLQCEPGRCRAVKERPWTVNHGVSNEWMDATILQVDLNSADQLQCDYVPRNPAVKHPLCPKRL